MINKSLFRLDNGVGGAYIHASSTLCAKIGVDDIDVALFNGLNGAFRLASATCNAGIINRI
jgi:hypothetical protein